MRALASLAYVVVSFCGLAFAQVRESKPAFEVASVKRSVNHEAMGTMRGGPGTDDPGRLTFRNAPLRMILSSAYGLARNDQLEGPDWIANRYDIVANVPSGVTKEECQAMLRNLLRERFQLKVRTETRQSEGYRLMVAKSGSKLKPSAADAPPAAVPDGFPRPGAEGIGVVGGSGAYLLTARHRSTSFLLQLLGVQLHAEIDDQTGLDGVYDYNLGFVPARFLETTEDHRFPDLVTAVEDQLGLKLVRENLPEDIVVIEKGNPEPLEN